MNPRPARRALGVLAAALSVLSVTGCALDGRGDLPFARGAGDDAFHVTVHMADISNLVPHAEVKVNDVTVGTVSAIRLENWQAVLDVSLARTVRLPADAIANVGQKSLLGAQYLQLAAPSTSTTNQLLVQGSDIPVERTGTYPNTEDLLIALSTFLNGSGLTQLRTVITEMNLALDGRTEDIKALLSHLAKLSGQLSKQRATVAQLLDRMDALTGKLALASPVIKDSLPSLAPGMAALNKQRPALMRAMRAVDRLDAVARPVLATNRDGLVKEIRELRPALSRVADAGNDAVDALSVAGTLVYPIDRVPIFFRGDYMQLFINFDARLKSIQDTLFAPSDLYTEDTVGGAGAAPTTAELFNPSTREGG